VDRALFEGDSPAPTSHLMKKLAEQPDYVLPA